MLCRTVIGLLLAVSIQAAEYQTGQAARAVIGQSGFSSRDAGVSATALSLDTTHLYAAEASGRVLTYDIAGIPGPKDDLSALRRGSCNVCGLSPAAVASQNVFPGIAGVSSYGRTVVVADPSHHHVLIWRDSSEPSTAPDLVLGHSDAAGVSALALSSPVSVAFDGKRLFIGDTGLHRILVWNSIPATGDQPPDAVLGQPDFYSSEINDPPRADSIRYPIALVSDGTNLYVSDTADRRILIFTPGETALPDNSVMNAATLAPGPVAPGTLVTIKGKQLSYRSDSVQQNPDENLPLKLAGVEVLFDGIAIPLLSVAPDEVQGQIPYGLENISSASLYIRTEHSDGSVSITNPVPIGVAPAAPGLYAFAGTEPRAGILLHRPDEGADSGGTPVTAESPAVPGEIVTLWATGLGAVIADEASPVEGMPFAAPNAAVALPVTASVNGRAAQVLSATLPQGAIGIYEIQVLVPYTETNHKAQLFITEHGISSNAILFPVRLPK